MTPEQRMEHALAELVDVLPEQITEEAALAAIRAAYLRGYLEAAVARPEAAAS